MRISPLPVRLTVPRREARQLSEPRFHLKDLLAALPTVGSFGAARVRIRGRNAVFGIVKRVFGRRVWVHSVNALRPRPMWLSENVWRERLSIYHIGRSAGPLGQRAVSRQPSAISYQLEEELGHGGGGLRVKSQAKAFGRDDRIDRMWVGGLLDPL